MVFINWSIQLLGKIFRRLRPIFELIYWTMWRRSSVLSSAAKVSELLQLYVEFSKLLHKGCFHQTVNLSSWFLSPTFWAWAYFRVDSLDHEEDVVLYQLLNNFYSCHDCICNFQIFLNNRWISTTSQNFRKFYHTGWFSSTGQFTYMVYNFGGWGQLSSWFSELWEWCRSSLYMRLH